MENENSMSTQPISESKIPKSESTDSIGSVDRYIAHGKHHKYDKAPKNKYSYGIACCRYNIEKSRTEILLIQKRCTYCFFEFVMGNYFRHDNQKLIELFNNMTNDEKVIIITCRFELMWHKLYLKKFDIENKSHISKYYNISEIKQYETYTNKKLKFEKSFLYDEGKRLRKLINDSSSIDLIWEIPKGRRSADDETDMETGIREFSEETHIDRIKYKILTDCPPIKETYVHMGVRYTNQYYISVAQSNINPKLHFNSSDQLSEIINIKWVSLSEIPQIDQYNRLHKVVKPIFNILKKKYKIQHSFY